MRPPPPPSWTVLAASSSRCARTKPTSTPPSAVGTWQLAADAQRLVVLGDLVRLRAVGIEVVLAVEHASASAISQPSARPDRIDFSTAAPFGTGSTPGVRQADRADVGVRLAAVAVRAAAEHLRARRAAGRGSRGRSPASQPSGDAHARSSSRGGTGSKPSARSKRAPRASSAFSAKAGPMSCRPIGRPSRSPHGTDRPGRPGEVDRAA